MAYDFSSLSHADFEDLCRDLVGRRLGVTFEAFAAGPDGGMDGRHARAGQTTVLQAKHYVGSSFSRLDTAMQKERPAINRLAANRYLLTTSRGLTPANKARLAAAIGPSLLDQDDILGAGDLNGLLRRYPDIEKAHIKLWLSSTAVLEKVLHAASATVTAHARAEIEAKLRVFAQNPSFGDAQSILEAQRVLIIAGPPGVGKTTLAEMLTYAYLAEGWELVVVRSLDDGFGAITDRHRQIFLFDDFLGKIALDAQTLAAKDSDLSRFMRLVRGSPNVRFILTTRAYIFEEARRISEHLSDSRLDISRYLLDVGAYTRRIRARILYNHLVVAGTRPAHVQALVSSEAVRKVVDHRNFNPRVIEWMTDPDRLGEVAPRDYPKAFLAALANPQRLWDTAYRTHIPPKCRHLLLTMYFCSEYGVEIEELQAAFEALHGALSAKYGIARDPKDFEEAVRILEGGFITIRDTQISYVNPSFRDYMSGYTADATLLCDCMAAATTARWAQAVWRAGYPTGLSLPDHRRLALAARDIAERLAHLPTWKRNRTNGYSVADLGNVDRLKLLLSWSASSGDARFADLALALAQKPPAPAGWSGYSGWGEGAELIALSGQLRDIEYYGLLAVAEPLVALLEEDIIRLLTWGLPTEDFENLLDAIEAADPPVSGRVREAGLEAIRREISEVAETIQNIDSESTLEEHAKVLARLAPLADIPPDALAHALTKVEDRISEIAEATPVWEPPAIPTPTSEPDVFDDDAIRNLFAPLLAR